MFAYINIVYLTKMYITKASVLFDYKGKIQYTYFNLLDFFCLILSFGCIVGCLDLSLFDFLFNADFDPQQQLEHDIFF